MGELPDAGDLIANRYRIERVLGRGGMGVAYAARNLVTGKQVALKWILREHTASRLRRVVREARAAGRIRHPNIVDVYDVGEHDGSLFLVMELLTGQSLQALIEARAPLTPEQILTWFMPALRGVRAAHRQGVIHRDLKPDNVFLCADEAGEPLTAKVLDFGVSKIISSDPALDDPSLTDSGTLLGTPSYIAPEQIEDARNADVRSDIYACGVILYHALSGKLPFVAGNYASLIVKIKTTLPTPLRELRPELPAALCAVIERAMQRDPQERFESIDALIQALEPFERKERAAAPERLAPVARVWTRPRRAQLAIALAILVGLSLWWAKPGLTASKPRPARVRSATVASTAQPVLMPVVEPGIWPTSEASPPAQAMQPVPQPEAPQRAAKPARARRSTAVRPARSAPAGMPQAPAPNVAVVPAGQEAIVELEADDF